MKLVARLAMTAAAATMAILPIAAQANTRAGDSNAVYSTSASQPGLGREAEGEDFAGSALGVILALFAATAIGAGIFFAQDSDDDGQSPGT